MEQVFGGGSLQNNAAGAFASVLKLPVAGYRVTTVGTPQGEGSYGRYWSSTVNGTYARRVQINSSNANVNSNGRAGGCPVRCIKE